MNHNLESGPDISKILILELGGIGDVILSIPAVLAVRNRFENAGVTVLTVPRSRDVLVRFGSRYRDGENDGLGGFGLEVLDPEIGFLGPAGVLSVMRRLRRESYDLLIDLSAVESDVAELRRWGAVKFIGAARSIGRGTDGRGSCFDESSDEVLTSTRHEMDRKLAVTDLLGARSPLTAPIFPILEHEWEEAGRFLEASDIREGRLLAAVFPGGLAAGKRWPVRCFREAIRWLTDNLGATVLVIGGSDCVEIAREVGSYGQHNSVIPATSLSLGASAGLLSRCSLFLTNDSGPMHLAAAMGVPTVAIFGRTNHSRYLPLLPESRRELAFADPELCSRGWKGGPGDECRKTDCRNPDCIRAVSVDEVISRMEALCSRIGLLYAVRTAHVRENLISGDPPTVKIGAEGSVTGDRATAPRGDLEDADLHDDSVRGDHNGAGSAEDVEDTIRYDSSPWRNPRDADGSVSPEDAGFITRRARRIARDLAGCSDGPVLDVACGKGYLMDDMERIGVPARNLWGIDIVMNQLEAARGRLDRSECVKREGDSGRNGNGVPRLIRGDLSCLPFRSGVFSAALCVNTLLNLGENGNLGRCLSEISRVTKPGGHVYVEIRNAGNPLVLSRFLLGRVFGKIPLTAHRLDDVIEAGREAGLDFSNRKPVGPLGRFFVYSYILDFVKEGQNAP